MASIRSGIGENMEDRYLFKAKRIDNREWVQGYLYGIWEKRYILWGMTNDIPDMIEVDPSTICQCTGLKDKNGKLIWENDIVKDFFSDACTPIRYGSYQNCFDSTKAEHIGFYVDWSGKYTKNYRKDLGYWIHMVDIEIIGNVFDNPELLGRNDE
jgi:uncharacterized phage protein (TIGR01671 family)